MRTTTGSRGVARGARRGAALLGAAALLGSLLLGPRLARGGSFDVSIVDLGSPELARKLRAEAAYAGFTPIERPPASGAPATLRILSSGRVELTVRRPDGATRFGQTLVSRPDERGSFALRVVEQLRARLVDVGWTLPGETEASAAPEPGHAASGSTEMPAAPDGVAGSNALPSSVAARAAVEEAASAPQDTSGARPGSAGRLWLGGGVAGSWASGGLDGMPHGALGVQVELGGPWQLGATLLWPLRDVELEAREGEASVAWTGVGAELEHSLPLPGPWLAGAALGVGLLVLDARGQARDEFSGRRERLYAGAYFAELSAGRELGSWARVRACALGGFTGPRPVLRFDEREVASLGRFVGSLGIRVDLSWPGAPEAAP